MSREANISQTLERFLNDRRDGDFTSVVKTFVNCPGEEQLKAFLFALTSGKVFASIILDGGEVTPSNALLMDTIEVQMAKLLEESKTWNVSAPRERKQNHSRLSRQRNWMFVREANFVRVQHEDPPQILTGTKLDFLTATSH